MKQETVLVVGASGTVGAQIVAQLKEKKYIVKASTHRRDFAQDKERVLMNLQTGEGVQAAFENVDKVFLLSPPGYVDQYQLLSPLVSESQRRGVKRVVLMTAMGANANEASPFRRVEVDLEKSGLSYNILRPNWFMQNFNTFWLEGLLKHKKILLPAGTAHVSFIDARDIGDVAVRLLTEERLQNKDFDLTGAEVLNHNDVAEVISQVTGEPIRYEEISSDLFKKNLIAAGLPADYSDFLVMIMGFLREGYNARMTDSIEQILGRAPRTFQQYAHDYKQAWNF
jgi:uncharacterized protein YbjT (DUF2867 family)